MNPNKLPAWTIKQLYIEMQEELDDIEKGHIERMNDIRNGHIELIKKSAIEYSRSRKLTPCEESILTELGININNT